MGTYDNFSGYPRNPENGIKCPEVCYECDEGDRCVPDECDIYIEWNRKKGEEYDAVAEAYAKHLKGLEDEIRG